MTRRLFGGVRKGTPKPELPEWLRAFLLEGMKPERGTVEFREYARLRYFRDMLAKLWARHRDRLIAECVAKRPGTRPYYWWLVEYEDDFEDFPVENEPQESYRARLDAHERESEASILRRRGLLLPGEAERTPPEAFLPVEPELEDLADVECRGDGPH